MKFYAIVCLAAFVASGIAEPFGKCPDVDGETPTYLPDILERNVFWECSQGIARNITCPGDLIHDPNSNVCDFPSRDAEPFGPIGVCERYSAIRLRDGLNVAVYWECVKGEAVMKKCPREMWFKPHYEGACYDPHFWDRMSQ